jgi:hypothetical protein
MARAESNSTVHYIGKNMKEPNMALHRDAFSLPTVAVRALVIRGVGPIQGFSTCSCYTYSR